MYTYSQDVHCTCTSKVFERNLLVDGLYFNSSMFLGNNRELDSNIAALSTTQEAFLQNNSLQSSVTNSISKYSFHLIDHRKCGPIGAVPFDHYNETPQHGGSYLMCLCKHILLSTYEKFRWSQSKFIYSNLNFTMYMATMLSICMGLSC